MLKLIAIALPIILGIISLRASTVGDRKKLFSESTPLQEPILKSLVKKISSVLEIPDIKIYVHEVKSFNGLATPNGTIFITRGTLDAFYSGKVTAEEISSIVAHELGHVSLGHSKKRMIDFSTQNALRIILSLAIGRLIPAVGTYIANFLTSILASKLSRNDEYEADAYAAALLTKAGIGVTPQISLLKKLDGLTGSASAPPVWLMSHPKAEDRINAIIRLSENWETTT